MKVMFSKRVKMLGTVAAVLALLAGLAVEPALASNMGFKNHRQIAPLGVSPFGQNWVALPFRNPYNTAQDVCDALGMPASGVILQIDAAAGVTLNNNGCGTGDFNLLPRVGLIVRNPVATSGMIVGSHQGNPPGSVTIHQLGVSPRGLNYFPVPFHTTAVDSEDACADLNIPLVPAAGHQVRRIDAAAGVTQIHTCGNGNLPNGFALRLGEAIRATQTTGAPINVPPGRPAHF